MQKNCKMPKYSFTILAILIHSKAFPWTFLEIQCKAKQLDFLRIAWNVSFLEF